MIKFIIIGLILYAAWIIYVYRHDIFKRKYNASAEKSEVCTSPTTDVMGKSNFAHSQSRTQAATISENENVMQKEDNFADTIQIPPEKLDAVFSEEINSDENNLDVNYSLEYDLGEFTEEEEEDLSVYGSDSDEVDLAEGVDFEDLVNVIKLVKNEPLKNADSEQIGKTLNALKNTDMFEKVVSSSSKISSVLKKHMDAYLKTIQQKSTLTETQVKDVSNFNIADYIN